MDALPGPDGRLRCPWGLSTPDYRNYHDLEWGQPVTSTQGLYERLTLEAFQSGLSWITILRKRANFRAAFAGFDPVVVASFQQPEVDRLMSDLGIVRNALKIDAAIANARVVAALGDEFAAMVLAFRRPDRTRPRSLSEVPARTAESTALSMVLKKAGIRFVGPTTAYALMQAVGLVDDHLSECFVEIGSGPPAGAAPLRD